MDSEMNVSYWLVGQDDDDKDKEPGPQDSDTIGERFCQTVTVKTERMKELELSFRNETSKVFAMETMKEVLAKPRISKEEKLKRVAVGVGRGPEEEMTKLLNNMVREEDQNMEVTVVMVDMEEVGVRFEEEGPKNQQCHTFRVGEEENKVFAVFVHS